MLSTHLHLQHDELPDVGDESDGVTDDDDDADVDSNPRHQQVPLPQQHLQIRY